MSNDIVQKGLETFHGAIVERDRLQGEVDRLRQELALERSGNDLLNLTLTKLSAERDHFQVKCAVLVNQLDVVSAVIADAKRQAHEESYGRREPAMPIDEQAQIDYAGGRQRQN